MKLAEKVDNSPKDPFAACSTLDRAVYRPADEQRAAELIQPSTHAYYHAYMTSTAVLLCTHKQTHA